MKRESAKQHTTIAAQSVGVIVFERPAPSRLIFLEIEGDACVLGFAAIWAGGSNLFVGREPIPLDAVTERGLGPHHVPNEQLRAELARHVATSWRFQIQNRAAVAVRVTFRAVFESVDAAGLSTRLDRPEWWEEFRGMVEERAGSHLTHSEVDDDDALQEAGADVDAVLRSLGTTPAGWKEIATTKDAWVSLAHLVAIAIEKIEDAEEAERRAAAPPSTGDA